MLSAGQVGNATSIPSTNPSDAPSDDSRSMSFEETELVGELRRPELNEFITRKGGLDPCLKDFIEDKITWPEAERCLLKKTDYDSSDHYQPADIFQLSRKVQRSIEAGKNFKKERTGWGSLSVSIGLRFQIAERFYPNLFTNWNQHHPGHEVNSNDLKVSAPGNMGTRVVLGSGGYKKSETWENALTKADLLDLTFYGGPNSLLFDSVNSSVFRGSALFPLAPNSFYDLGFVGFETNAATGTTNVFSARGGIQVQIQGVPIDVSENLLNLTGISSFFQSHTMLRAGFQASIIAPSRVMKKNYCDKVGSYEVPQRGGPSIKHNCEVKGRNPWDSSAPHVDAEDKEFNDLPPDNGGENLKATFEIYGRQETPRFLIQYSVYAAHYSLGERIETGASLEGEWKITQAIRLYGGLQAMGMWALGDAKDEGNISFPTQAHQFLIEGGLRLVPTHIF